jgi:hypothetical protein
MFGLKMQFLSSVAAIDTYEKLVFIMDATAKSRIEISHGAILKRWILH